MVDPEREEGGGDSAVAPGGEAGGIGEREFGIAACFEAFFEDFEDVSVGLEKGEMGGEWWKGLTERERKSEE